MDKDAWYFAYGSNLSVAQKELRMGSIRKAVRCRLPGYRLAFNKQGSLGQIYANIVKQEGEHLWGVIYLCSRAAFEQMDRCEGVPGCHYYQEHVTVILDSGEEVQAITYIAGPSYVCPEGPPSNEYLNKILSGARQHGLPADYISTIECHAQA